MKGFKCQITVKVSLNKQNENVEREFTNVYSNSTDKTVINLNKFGVNKSFQQVLYRLDNWIDEEYLNISIYSPLSGSIYIELPDELKNSMKGSVNIKNNIRHLNPLKTHPKKITKVDKKVANDLDYKGINFPFSKKRLH